MSNDVRIQAAARRVAALIAARTSVDGRAMLARLLGALHGLAAVERSGVEVPPVDTTTDELATLAATIATGAAPPDAWLAGYHFNSAIHRVRTVAETLGLTTFAKKAPAEWTGITRRDNAFKHGNDELIGKHGTVRTVGEALERVETILAALE